MAIRSLLSLLFLQLKTQFLRFFFIHKIPQHSNNLEGPCLIPLCSYLLAYIYWWHQNWAQYARCGVIISECNNHAPCDEVVAVTDMICLCYCKGTQLIHFQSTNTSTSFLAEVLQPVSFQPVLLIGIIPSLLLDFIFVFVKSHVTQI